MSLPEFEAKRIERIFGKYCEDKIPLRVRDKVRIVFKARGTEVKLFECRPRYDDPSIWTEMPVARFKKDEQKGVWILYCADRNGKWHLFEPYHENRDIERLLAEVKHDRTGTFWG